MFKRILIPTDGTPLSARAVKAGIKLARQTGAHVTGYHAAEPGRRTPTAKGSRPRAP